MSADCSRNQCKIAIIKILQSIGWHSINSTPLEYLTDMLSDYMLKMGRITHEYANQFGQTDPNLDHLGLAFLEMNVNLKQLEEYATYVNFLPPAESLPKYPLPKESNLNFLKPGRKEVVTRPIHINEYLPPMYPLLEEQSDESDSCSHLQLHPEKANVLNDANGQYSSGNQSKSPELKTIKKDEEISRPTREISSVIMTTSGFLSPACEGKLPEAKSPVPPPEPPRPPTPIAIMPRAGTPAPFVPEIITTKKKKERLTGKDGSNRGLSDGKILKRGHATKETKMKQTKAKMLMNSMANPWNLLHSPSSTTAATFMHSANMHLHPPFASASASLNKHPLAKSNNFNKTLAAAKAKAEKLNTTITPINAKFGYPNYNNQFNAEVDKINTEPDRNKINILKKISNVKHDKATTKAQQINPHLMQQTRDLVNKINLSRDLTIEPITNPTTTNLATNYGVSSYENSPPKHSPEQALLLNSSNIKENKKKKDKIKVKRPRKQMLPHFNDIMDYPKTSERLSMASGLPTFASPFASTNSPSFRLPFPNLGGPGLIPHPYPNSLFPFSPLIPGMPDSSLLFSNPVAAAKCLIPPPTPPPPSPPPAVVPVPKTSPNKQHPPQQQQNTAEIVPLTSKINTENENERNPDNVFPSILLESGKKSKEHKKDRKDKIKKKNKKDKIKDKSEKKKLKVAKKEKEKKDKKKQKKLLMKDPDHVTIPNEISGIPKILLKVNSPAPATHSDDSSSVKKLNIKPVVKKESVAALGTTSLEHKRETSPGLAKIAALVTGPPKQKSQSNTSPMSVSSEKSAPESVATVTNISATVAASLPRPQPGRPRIHPLKPKSTPKPKKVQQQPFTREDADGNIIWFCPECNLQDDGRPMIGCDGCDAWYHWVCVGIQVPPDNSENWYCRRCIAKKNEDLHMKKKKRKKKIQV